MLWCALRNCSSGSGEKDLSSLGVSVKRAPSARWYCRGLGFSETRT
jgi:hypothetical protein